MFWFGAFAGGSFVVCSEYLAYGRRILKGSHLMGYYVFITEGTFTVPKASERAAYAAVCALNQRDELKSGGAWGGDADATTPRPAGLDYHPGRWFSWMDANYPAKCATLAQVFEALGFSVVEDDEGVHICGYDSKIGQETLFLAAIAPYCVRSSWLEWRGEGGEVWRHTISGTGALLCWEGETVFTGAYVVNDDATEEGEGVAWKTSAPCEACGGSIDDGALIVSIAAVLSGFEWGPETCDTIAALVRASGRVVEDFNPQGGAA